MKAVPQDIQKVFLAVKDLVQNQRVSELLAQPIEIDTLPTPALEHAKHAFLQRTQIRQDPRVYLARFWLALVALVVIEMNKDHDLEDIHTLLRPIMLAVVLTALILFYETTIGPLPLQRTVNKCLLPKKEYEQQQKYIDFRLARSEAARKGPRSGWGLLINNPKLEKIFQERKIHVMIQESILIALSSIKYKSFDCVAITGIVLLKLIEQKVPYTLKWYYKPGNHFDGHNFIIASDSDQDNFIIDPWHGVCTNAKQMDSDSDFLLSYPLLSTDDKEVLATIKPDDFRHYQGYIDMLNEALSKRRDFSV